MMQLKEILNKKGGEPVAVAASGTVADAIQTMSAHRVGSVMVLAATGEPVGILTERDVLRLCAAGQTDFAQLPLSGCMTSEMTVGKPSDTVSEVLAIMTSKRFRHLPVVEDGKMVGVVSIGDLVKAKLEETAIEAQTLREYINS